MVEQYVSGASTGGGANPDNITLDSNGAGGTLEIKSGGVKNTQVNSGAAIANSKIVGLANLGANVFSTFPLVPGTDVNHDILAALVNGTDLRTGITAADGSPLTVYGVPSGGGVVRIGGSFSCTAYTSGTVTYAVTWTDENGAIHTLSGSLTGTGHFDFVPVTVRVKASSNVTAQITGVFVATVSPVATVEKLG